jgi:hypothetical protein
MGDCFDTKSAPDGKHQSITWSFLSLSPSSVESEKELRREIADRNSKVENEAQYAILDGVGMRTTITTEETKDGVEEPSKDASAAIADAFATDESKALEKKLDRLIKQRPYALFLMEKAAEIVEDIVADTFSGETSAINAIQREKIVVLGTGWGAAAFLKGIDTSLYDVTVVSPRNYFVFTPMLAGASVGTVDYRSITEPVREVSHLLYDALLQSHH